MSHCKSDTTKPRSRFARIYRTVSDETGASAIEYGLIVGLIAVVIIAALTLTGSSLKGLFENVAGDVADAAASSSGSSSSP
jgi:pilus assembly protein Flp/PilA